MTAAKAGLLAGFLVIVAAAVGLAAYGSLDERGQSQVIEEMAKLAVQFIVIVVAGAVVR